jgi:WD40 repeat protein
MAERGRGRIFWLCLWLLILVGADTVPTGQGQEILRFLRQIPVPDNEFPTYMVWSPDGRYLALTTFNGLGFVLDVTGRDPARELRYHLEASEFPTTDTEIGRSTRKRYIELGGWLPISDGVLAWSPDDKWLATAAYGSFDGVHLFSVEQGYKEVARFKNPHAEDPTAGCWLALFGPSSGKTMAFTSDSRSLWVGCVARSTQKSSPFIAAIKLRLPDLVQEDQLVLDPPVEGVPADPWKFNFQMINNHLILNIIIWSNSYRKDWRNESIEERYVYSHDLENKQEVFPHFRLEPDDTSGFDRIPMCILVHRDRARVTVVYGTAYTQLHPPGGRLHESLDRLAETYDTGSGRRISAFGGLSKLDSHDFWDAALFGASDRLVTTTERNNIGRYYDTSDITVFDGQDGRQLQKITDKFLNLIAVNEDQKLIAVSEGNDRMGTRAIMLYHIDSE